MPDPLLLFLLCAAFVLYPVLRRFYWHRVSRALLARPAAVAAFEVSLSRGVDDSIETFERLHRKLSSSLTPRGADRRNGVATMRVVYHAERQGEHVQVRCLVYCDPGAEEQLRRYIREDFAGAARLVRLADDPIERLLGGLRAPA